MQGRSVDEYRSAPVSCLAAHQPMQRALHRLLRGVRSRQGVARRAVARRGARPRAAHRPRRHSVRRLRRRRAAGRSARWDIFELLPTPVSRSSSRPTAAASTTPPPTASPRSHRSACRSRSTAPPPRRTSACARVELRRSDRRDRPTRRRAVVAPQFVFVPTRLNLARDRRGLRPRRVARLQRIRHRTG